MEFHGIVSLTTDDYPLPLPLAPFRCDVPTVPTDIATQKGFNRLSFGCWCKGEKGSDERWQIPDFIRLTT